MPRPAPVKYPGTARFKVGDRVTFNWGGSTIPAVVIEDRGPLGGGGRRLCLIRAEWKYEEPDEFNMLEDELTPA